MINLKYSAAFLLLSSSLALANGTLPVTPTYLGLDYMLTESPLNEVGCISGLGCGGQFTATFQQASTAPVGTPPDYLTPGSVAATANMFCVDSQEDFSPGQGGLALVESMASIDGNPLVRYASPVAAWDNSLSGLGLTATQAADARVRYEMAAYLVSKYDGFSLAAITTSDANNDAIQEAIWAIMDNSGGGVNYYPTGSAPNTSAVDLWVATAAAQYTTLQGDWAVVSWNANATTGALDPIGTDNAQTFIVQLDGGPSTITTGDNPTPEPGFYGALALGLSGLFFAVRRRKKA